MNIHAFYAFAFLVLTIGSAGVVLAQGQIKEPVAATATAAPAISAPVMDESTVVSKKVAATAEVATDSPAVNYQQPVCVVTGTVQSVQMIEKTPWDDGTPTTLTTTEIRIALALEARTMQRGTQGSSDCSLSADKPAVLYKLCSPTMVKKGDRIRGVEGLATGSDQSLGCLFDVAVDSAPATPTGQ